MVAARTASATADKVTAGSPRHGSVDGAAPGALAQPVEIEIKLLCAPDVAQQVMRTPLLQQMQPTPLRRTQLDATYFDTPDAQLQQRLWALRVRKDSAGLHTLTLKTPVGDGHGGVARNEWNHVLRDGAVDLTQVGAWFSALDVADLNPDLLAPLFQTLVDRQSCELTVADGVVELTADHGRIVAGARSDAISEIELELVSGAPAAIFDVALRIADAFDVRVAVHSKAARGYTLALGRGPTPVKASTPESASDASLDATLRASFHTVFEHVLANLAAARTPGVVEGVHQLRVALRRLRSLLGVVKSLAPSHSVAGLGGEAKWLMNALGRPRNLDVFAEGVFAEAQKACGAWIDFSALDRRLGSARDAAWADAATALDSRRATVFLLRLGHWIASAGWREGGSSDTDAMLRGSARAAAIRAVARRRRQVLKKGRGFDKADAAALHEVRLALKKLRYTAELFSPVLPAGHDERGAARRLARLQDVFGRYNDLHGALAVLHELRQQKGRAGADVSLAIGAIYGRVAAEEEITLAQLRRKWRRFRKAAKAHD